MASTFVHGPTHLFVGIDPVLVSALAIVPTALNAVFLPGSDAPDYGSTGGSILTAGGAINPAAGATLGNNPRHPPPAQLVTILLKVGYLPVYLGTAEKSPSIELVRGWLPWYDDELGASLPADELYEGEEAWVTADVSRWNEPVYAFLAQVINRGPLGGARGMNFAGDVGTSMAYEGYTYPLILQFPFAGKPLYAARGMPPGYRFFSATLAGPDRLEPLGTGPTKRRLLWRCREYLDLESGAMALYDHNAANPGIN
jgi:hypothetical protein